MKRDLAKTQDIPGLTDLVKKTEGWNNSNTYHMYHITGKSGNFYLPKIWEKCPSEGRSKLKWQIQGPKMSFMDVKAVLKTKLVSFFRNFLDKTKQEEKLKHKIKVLANLMEDLLAKKVL